MEKKPRVLYICPWKFGIGGVQVTIMQLARQLSTKNVSMDVVVFSEEKGYYEEEFLKYGKIFRIPLKRGGTLLRKIVFPYLMLINIYRGICKILDSEEKYDAIHVAFLFYSAPCVLAAKRRGVPVRITHSHVECPNDNYSWYVRVYNSIYQALCRRVIVKNSTVGLGVTKGSLQYLFGNMNNVHVIHNPVLDSNIFDINKYEIEKEREYLGLIQVGNFCERKNQLFTLNVLLHLKEKGINCKLTLIGSDNHAGEPYKQKMNSFISQHSLDKDVTFLPSNTNVAKAMVNADILMMPSLQEGLPNVVLEAQCMGLKCFLSDDISNESDCGLCSFYSLKNGVELWSNNIIEYYAENGHNKHFVDMSKYSIENVCNEHLQIWKGEKYNN